jgi:hypothetical protein
MAPINQHETQSKFSINISALPSKLRDKITDFAVPKVIKILWLDSR